MDQTLITGATGHVGGAAIETLLKKYPPIKFIHDKLIDLAKEKFSTTDLSVNQIAYNPGFEHLQSFSNFFKIKTNQSPLEFRASFN